MRMTKQIRAIVVVVGIFLAIGAIVLYESGSLLMAAAAVGVTLLGCGLGTLLGMAAVWWVEGGDD